MNDKQKSSDDWFPEINDEVDNKDWFPNTYTGENSIWLRIGIVLDEIILLVLVILGVYLLNREFQFF